MAWIFLCHASADKSEIRDIYKRLQSDGFQPWLDEEELLGGQLWEQEIPKALRASTFVLIFFSQHSVDKEGYIQRELKLALDVWQDIPEGRIHTIPIRLDESPIPDQFGRFQWIDLFQDGGYDRLVRSIRYGLEERGLPIPDGPMLPPEDRSATIRRHITDQIEVLREANGGVFLYGDLTDQVPETFLTWEISPVIEQMRLEGLIAFHGPFDPRSSTMEFPPQPQESPSAMHTPDGPHTVSASQTPVTPGSTLVPSFTTSIGMEFVLIPAGEFTMGSPHSDQNARDDEKPAHQVTISQPFYLGKYSVTQAQWQAVMGVNPSHFQSETRPVEGVSWEDVQSFMNKLNERDRMASYRLPTEAEWEYASRAGSSTVYHFGDEAARLSEYAWYSENSGNQTNPVGQRKPNDWGLYDMHGNIFEWVQDWYARDYYQNSSITDPRGPGAGAERVIRGGCWGYPARRVRAAFRDQRDPRVRHSDVGFRCLSSASESGDGA